MRQLLIFLKYPTPGQVKTRLAVDLGDHAAASIYRASTELTLERLARFREETMLHVDPSDAMVHVKAWLGAEWMMRPQAGHTLGERLQHATRRAFEEGCQRLIVIGTDTPWLMASEVDAVFTALELSDVVLGPTDDGGYYLIGLSRDVPALFEGIAWSSSTVYAQTLACAARAGLRVQTLRCGYDLDYVRDVERFLAEEQRRQPMPALVRTIATQIQQRRQPCRS